MDDLQQGVDVAGDAADQGRDRQPAGLAGAGRRRPRRRQLTRRSGADPGSADGPATQAGWPAGPARPSAGPLGRRRRADRRQVTLVLAACSGGADSLALAAALAFEAPRLGLRPAGSPSITGCSRGRPRRPAGVAAILRRARASTRCTRSASGRRPRRAPALPGPGGGGPDGQVRRAGRGRGRVRGRPPSCSGTPWTTRPRPCCSGWPAAPGARSLAGMAAASRPVPAPAARPAPRPRPGRPARRWAWSRGRTRTTADPGLRQGPGRAAGCCPRWRQQLGPGVGRGAGPDRRPAAGRRRRAGRAGRQRPAGSAAGRRPGSAAGRAWPLAALPARDPDRVLRPAAIAAGARRARSPGARRRSSTPWSPAGTASAGSTCPAASGASGGMAGCISRGRPAAARLNPAGPRGSEGSGGRD